MVRGLFPENLNSRHYVPVLDSGDTVENFERLIRNGLGGGTPLRLKVVENGLKPGYFLGRGLLNLFEKFFHLGNLLFDLAHLIAGPVNFLHQFQSAVFKFGVIGLEGVELRQDCGIFLVGLGGVKSDAEFVDFFFSGLQFQFDAAGVFLMSKNLIMKRLALPMQLVNPPLLNAHSRITTAQLPANISELAFDCLKGKHRLQCISHTLTPLLLSTELFIMPSGEWKNQVP